MSNTFVFPTYIVPEHHHALPPVDISVILVAGYDFALFRRCLQSVFASMKAFQGTFEIVLVLSQAHPPPYFRSAFPKEVRKLAVPLDDPLEYILLRGANYARGKYITFLQDHHTVSVSRFSDQFALMSSHRWICSDSFRLGGESWDDFCVEMKEEDANKMWMTWMVERDSFLYQPPSEWCKNSWVSHTPLHWRSAMHEDLSFSCLHG
jgi:hypothetical protein